MLFDVVFLGLPIAIVICLGNLALRDSDMRLWTCCFSFFAYILFYLAGGRDVILYLSTGMLMAHSWVGTAGPAP